MWSRSGSTGRISLSPTGSGGLTQSVIRKIAQPSDERDDRGEQHADARLVLSCRFGDRDVDDEKRDGEADSGQRGAAGDPAQRQPRRQLADARCAA